MKASLDMVYSLPDVDDEPTDTSLSKSEAREVSSRAEEVSNELMLLLASLPSRVRSGFKSDGTSLLIYDSLGRHAFLSENFFEGASDT